MTLVDPGPMPTILGRAPVASLKSVSGCSSRKIAAAARLYPNIFASIVWAIARSRR